MIKEIIYFGYGDSTKASTWSNVPYLLTTTLQKKGIKIRRIDISPNRYISKAWKVLEKIFISPFYPGEVYTFDRTPLFKQLTERKIRKAVKKYSSADYCIFTCFDFYNKFNDIPTLLFCDWTYDILIIDRLKRKPYPFESRYSRQQGEAINSAKCVISLFPVCAETMKKKYPSANIHYLGTNVINSLYEGKLDGDFVVKQKDKSEEILFIGGKKYLDGAKKLVEAFKRFVQTHPNAGLHLIGLKKEYFSSLPHNVICHGYLQKDKEGDKELYYKLLLNAKVIVNPSPLWAGYSSTIEAMFFYTPVIVSPYKDFVDEFGKDIPFGIYNNEYTADSV